jgi:hypothetical protein
VLECLPNKFVALSSSPSTTKKKERKKVNLFGIFQNTMILFWECINSIKKCNQEWRKHQAVSNAQQEDGLQETVDAFVLHPPYI